MRRGALCKFHIQTQNIQNQASLISIVLTIPLINECFGVGVTSEAMDGVAPELNPGWVRRRKNTYPEVRYATYRLLKTNEQTPLNTLYHAMTSTPQIKKPSRTIGSCCSVQVLFFP